MSIETLQPTSLWGNFYKLTQIPHPSGYLTEMSEFLKSFAKQHQLQVETDKVGNILIKKPATHGFEDRQTVVWQAHMDMVPQKDGSIEHDFQKDALKPVVDGEWVRASGTTLGADNGIGLAAALAVLESQDLKHGPIEAFFTVDEETGMIGANGLTDNFLSGDILLNMDSEDEGELYVGCAGGVDATMTFRYKEVSVPEGDVAVKVCLSGLRGGHSGLEINEGRANANKLLFRFLKEAIMLYEARLSSVEGGNMRNAIPREACAVLTIPADTYDELEILVQEYEDLFNEEYRTIENEIVFTISEVELPSGLIPEEVQDDLVNAVTACPNGVFRFIPEIPDTVETSTNLSIVKSSHDSVEVACLLRSSADSKKDELASMIESVFALAGAKVEFSGSYSGWNPNMNSAILHTMQNVYEKEFGEKPAVKVVHAGLECGIIGPKVPNMDMISFGPTIRHPHTPNEKVNIASVEKFWKFLTATLVNIPTKK